MFFRSFRVVFFEHEFSERVACAGTNRTHRHVNATLRVLHFRTQVPERLFGLWRHHILELIRVLPHDPTTSSQWQVLNRASSRLQAARYAAKTPAASPGARLSQSASAAYSEKRPILKRTAKPAICATDVLHLPMWGGSKIRGPFLGASIMSIAPSV